MKNWIILLSVSLLIGCAKNIVLHPITNNDIFTIKKGTNIEGNKTKKDGYFISNFYLKEVAKARIDK